MSLVSQISSLATRIATEFKTVNSRTGTLTDLSTTSKTSLVSAINEVNSKPSGTGGAAINDAAPSTTTTYSGSKSEALVTTLNSAINAKPSINDTTASGTSVYSSSKTQAQIDAKVAALVASAPAALDTLKELSDALGGDASFAATTATALGNRLRVDASQTLTSGQKTFGQNNLDVYSKTDVGNVDTNFVNAFEAGLA